MTCYHPIRAYRTSNGVSFTQLARGGDFVGDIELPCGQCIGCRMRRASDWSLRVMHEASLWPDNCFVTLTYGADKLPPYGSLWHDDYAAFMKRLRWKKGKVRFYMCGEYGPLNLRPHYHACLFNVHFREDMVPAGTSASGELFYHSDELAALWTHGIVSVQDLTPETASYAARYIMKKALGKSAETAYERVTDDGEIVRVKPEYAAMSLKPGIGAEWYKKYSREVFPSDEVVQNGVRRQVPKYYDKLLKREGTLVEDKVEWKRQQAAKRARENTTEERLKVREEVHLARVSKLKRSI